MFSISGDPMARTKTVAKVTEPKAKKSHAKQAGPSFYEEFTMLVPLSKLGKINKGTISDGRAEYEYRTVKLDDKFSLGTVFYEGRDVYYIDNMIEIRRLSTDLIDKFKLGKYFSKSSQK